MRITGHIVIVQEDRIRVLDDAGRGYLLVVHRGAASLAMLERWRDEAQPLDIEFSGSADRGAVATSLRIASVTE